MRVYPVLVPLSACYPEYEDRLSTRYSPVRHSTHGRSRFRVRLACVKHAASVRSEPGSNSPVRFPAKSQVTKLPFSHPNTSLARSSYSILKDQMPGFLPATGGLSSKKNPTRQLLFSAASKKRTGQRPALNNKQRSAYVLETNTHVKKIPNRCR